MKRSRVMQFLCCLSLMLFVICSDQFLIKTHAAEFYDSDRIIENSFTLTNVLNSYDLTVHALGVDHNFQSRPLSDDQVDSGDYHFYFDTPGIPGMTGFVFNKPEARFHIQYNPELYDYYFAVNVLVPFPDSSAPDLEFFRFAYSFESISFCYGRSGVSGAPYMIRPAEDSKYYLSMSTDTVCTTYVFKLPDPFYEEVYYSLPTGFLVNLNTSTRCPSLLGFEGSIYAVSKSSSFESVADAIVNAINSQTSSISGKIDSSTTKILSKLSDIYSTNVDTSGLNAVYDYVIPAIQEKSETLYAPLTFFTELVDCFYETPPEPIITIPPLSIKIKDTSYQWFNGFSYNLNSLRSGPLLVLVEALHTAVGIALFFALLKYLQRVHDDIFNH